MPRRLTVTAISMLAVLLFAYSGSFAGEDEACRHCDTWSNPDGSTCDHADYDHEDKLHNFKSLFTTNRWTGSNHVEAYCGSCAMFHEVTGGICRGEDDPPLLLIGAAVEDGNVRMLADILARSPRVVFNANERRIATLDCGGHPTKVFDVPADIALELAGE